jgi:hypothetical protein
MDAEIVRRHQIGSSIGIIRDLCIGRPFKVAYSIVSQIHIVIHCNVSK